MIVFLKVLHQQTSPRVNLCCLSSLLYSGVLEIIFLLNCFYNARSLFRPNVDGKRHIIFKRTFSIKKSILGQTGLSECDLARAAHLGDGSYAYPEVSAPWLHLRFLVGFGHWGSLCCVIFACAHVRSQMCSLHFKVILSQSPLEVCCLALPSSSESTFLQHVVIVS